MLPPVGPRGVEPKTARKPAPPYPILNTSLQLAAIDLGSNSFRLEIGRADGGQIYVLDSLRSNVRLAAGLTPDKRLTTEAMDRGLEAIAQFAQRLQGFDPSRIRAVGTNTLRVAKNAPEFIARMEAVLGFPIEVIAGREEARLIFSGVAHSVPTPYGKRLVVDIGGGSTEFSVGTGFEPDLMESLYMGSINYTLDHFPGGFIDDFTLKQAELAARREVQVIAADIMVSGWHTAIASSGTARSISRILRENKGNNTTTTSGTIDIDGLRWLRKMMLGAGKIEALKLAGLKPERALNLPGGFAILSAVFAELGISSMQVADNSLRLGVLYDLLSRIKEPNGPHDKRQNTVAQFEERYHVDRVQARRIISLALSLAAHLKPVLREKYFEAIRFIEWSARLHEAGLTIAHNGYHKHSAYIIANADMPGFSKAEQQRLAFLILGHAGKLPKLARQRAGKSEWLSMACLRLAALFYRSRQDLPLPDMRLALADDRLTLEIDPAWLAKHPLTEYSLSQEIKHWEGLGAAQPFSFELAQAETATA